MISGGGQTGAPGTRLNTVDFNDPDQYLTKGALNEINQANRTFTADDEQRSLAVGSQASQISNATSILSKMKSRMVSFNRTNGSSLKVGVNQSDHDFGTHEQFNDMTQARRRRFDFVQSNVVGPNHLKSANIHEMVRVLANGKRLNSLKAHSGDYDNPVHLDHPIPLTQYLDSRVIPSSHLKSLRKQAPFLKPNGRQIVNPTHTTLQGMLSILNLEASRERKGKTVMSG